MRIELIDEQGGVLREYSSLGDAAIDLGIPQSAISQCISGKVSVVTPGNHRFRSKPGESPALKRPRHIDDEPNAVTAAGTSAAPGAAASMTAAAADASSGGRVKRERRSAAARRNYSESDADFWNVCGEKLADFEEADNAGGRGSRLNAHEPRGFGGGFGSSPTQCEVCGRAHDETFGYERFCSEACRCRFNAAAPATAPRTDPPKAAVACGGGEADGEKVSPSSVAECVAAAGPLEAGATPGVTSGASPAYHPSASLARGAESTVAGPVAGGYAWPEPEVGDRVLRHFPGFGLYEGTIRSVRLGPAAAPAAAPTAVLAGNATADAAISAPASDVAAAPTDDAAATTAAEAAPASAAPAHSLGGGGGEGVGGATVATAAGAAPVTARATSAAMAVDGAPSSPGAGGRLLWCVEFEDGDWGEYERDESQRMVSAFRRGARDVAFFKPPFLFSNEGS